ncbi:MAG: HD-GYP domain-containing protein, partial [Lysinibacillus sp.]
MRLISITALREGMTVGRTIWNEAGHPLLQKGVVINDVILNRLSQLSLQYIYVEDKLSEGINVEETIQPEVRNKAVHAITSSFHAVRDADAEQASYVLDQQSKELGNIIDDLLTSILESDEVLMVLTDAYMYDEYLYQHSFQVTLYTLAIAKELGYCPEDLRVIGIGAMLHDVGKMLIPPEILQKPDRLTDEEFELMKMHTTYGFDILRNLHSVSLIVAHCAFQHHERLDGSGYPRGILRDEIHPFAKIISVADVYDAVTSTRVYRSKMLPSQGMAIIEAGSGTQFEPEIVEALRRSIVHYPNGTIVVLSDGRRGVVCKQNNAMPDCPFIRIF